MNSSTPPWCCITMSAGNGAAPSGILIYKPIALSSDSVSCQFDSIANRVDLVRLTQALNQIKRSIIARQPGEESIRSEEHTSELQSRRDLVCRLLLEKKKKKKNINT